MTVVAVKDKPSIFKTQESAIQEPTICQTKTRAHITRDTTQAPVAKSIDRKSGTGKRKHPLLISPRIFSLPKTRRS